jgi:type II secretory pathway pseudopilin PulG
MRSGRRGQEGFTLVFALLLVVLLGIFSVAGARSYTKASRRAAEEELLFRGRQYIDAIGRYHRFQGRMQYPTTLEAVLKDPRTPATVRHLRKAYPDPVTGEPFEPIKTPEGWLIGVRSSSERRPEKDAEFPQGLETFAGKTKYKEWEFIYRPPVPGRIGPFRLPGARPFQQPGK